MANLESLLSEADYIELGKSVAELTLAQANDSETIEFKAAPKQCQKGLSCGASCVSKAKACVKPLEGQAKTFAGWLKMQLAAGLQFLKSKVSKKKASASTPISFPPLPAKTEKPSEAEPATPKPPSKPITPPSTKVNWDEPPLTPEQAQALFKKIEDNDDPADAGSSEISWERKFENPKWKQPPPPPSAIEMSAIAAYTGDGFEDINRALRRGVDDETEQETLINTARLINSGLKQLPGYTEGNTYRGTDLTPEQLAQYEAGATITANAFESSAKVPSKAWGGNTYFVMIPKGEGTAVKDIQRYSREPDESEALWPPGTKYKVLDVKQDYQDPESGEFRKNYIVLKEE